MESLKHKGILITGASRGLGRALAEELGARGARLALVGRDRVALEETTRVLATRDIQAYALVHDVGDTERVGALAAEAQALVGPIEVLIHNASDLGPTPLPLLLDTTREDFERVFRVNVLGPFVLSRALAGPMALKKTGQIVHISSDAAINAYPRWGVYGASKAALDQLSRIWAEELRDHGVRVLSIDPGEMNTQMHRDAIPDADPASLREPTMVAKQIARLIVDGNIPTGSRVVA